jgi:hypothetical protein
MLDHDPIPFAIAFREVPLDAGRRVLEALRAERLLGVLAVDDFAASTGQGFGSLLGAGGGRVLVVRDDGEIVAIDAATVAARLQRRLDASVQLDADAEAEVVESTPAGFEPWTTIPEREAQAERAAVRWVAVLPEPAEVAARWLTELATLVDGDVVLVPAGDRSLLVCDAWRFAPWPKQLRPLVAVMQSASTVGLYTWLVRRIAVDGHGRRRLLPSAEPDWSVVWGSRPIGILPSDGYRGLDAAQATVHRAVQAALVERIELEIPHAVDEELGLGSRRSALERLLALDAPEVSTAAIVDALALPSEIVPLAAGDVDAAELAGARSAQRQSIARTFAGSMRDELRHGNGGGALALVIALSLYLASGAALAVLAGFGVLTREQTLGNPWFYGELALLAVVCVALGSIIAPWWQSRQRRRTPVGED